MGIVFHSDTLFWLHLLKLSEDFSTVLKPQGLKGGGWKTQITQHLAGSAPLLRGTVSLSQGLLRRATGSSSHSQREAVAACAPGALTGASGFNGAERSLRASSLCPPKEKPRWAALSLWGPRARPVVKERHFS